jgi:hypothetical protein
VFLSLILRRMPFYVVRKGRNPGIYNTWLVGRFFFCYLITFFVFKGMNVIKKFINFLEVRIEYSKEININNLFL